MSLEAFSWSLNVKVGDSRRKLILQGLANHAHKDGTAAFCSRETLAEYAECDVKTVTRHLKALVRDGFIRLGDQALVEYIRADRRPRVYDLAMTATRQELWRAAQAPVGVLEAHAARGDKLTPRDGWDGESRLCPVVDGDEGSVCPPVEEATGGHLATSRGDTAMSPEPSLNQQPPQPPSELGGACPKHTTTPGPGCRACGTSTRQLEERRRAAAAERRRAIEAAAAAAARAHADATRVDSTSATGRRALAQVRAAVVRELKAGR